MVIGARGLGVTIETRGMRKVDENKSDRDQSRDWWKRASLSVEDISRVLLRFDDGGSRGEVGARQENRDGAIRKDERGREETVSRIKRGGSCPAGAILMTR